MRGGSPSRRARRRAGSRPSQRPPDSRRAANGCTTSVARGMTLTTAAAVSGVRRQTSISCTTARKSSPTSAAEARASARLAACRLGPTGAPSGSRSTLLPRTTTAATRASAAIGACARKIARQVKTSVSTPPSAGPSAAPKTPAPAHEGRSSLGRARQAANQRQRADQHERSSRPLDDAERDQHPELDAAAHASDAARNTTAPDPRRPARVSGAERPARVRERHEGERRGCTPNHPRDRADRPVELPEQRREARAPRSTSPRTRPPPGPTTPPTPASGLARGPSLQQSPRTNPSMPWTRNHSSVGLVTGAT